MTTPKQKPLITAGSTLLLALLTPLALAGLQSGDVGSAEAVCVEAVEVSHGIVLDVSRDSVKPSGDADTLTFRVDVADEENPDEAVVVACVAARSSSGGSWEARTSLR